MNNIYIYDLETYFNFFLATFKVPGKDIWYEFEISDRKNQIKELREFLDKKPALIGFNNVNFDYPVLHNTILKSKKNWIAEEIYEEIQKIINSEYSSIWDNKTILPQLDLYKIWHYDNKNKRTSLKWLEFAMRMENIEDLPYHPSTVLNDTQKNEVISYCRNDIDATEKFYYNSVKHIQIRQFYTKLEGINLINASETKMAKEIFAKYLSKEMGIEVKDLKQRRTYREKVNISKVLFDYIEFSDPINQETLQRFKNFTKTPANSLGFSVKYKNVIREYGEGGLHSFGKSGIYETDDDYLICDVDFASYYPHLTFKNNLHPHHIPEKVFNEIYEGFYHERKNYPKSDPRNYVLKILLNSSYGLSKDQYAFLYDPEWQLAVTINGQLILAMLTEKIFEKLSEGLIIFENTDGAAYRIKRSEYDNLIEACKEIEEITKIPLEIQICDRLIMRDVNHYINVINKDTIKFKGAYEIDRDFHKNHSKRVVAITAANYFINDIQPEITLKNHLNGTSYDFAENYGIFDFCIGSKMIGQNKLFKRDILGTEIIDTPLGKVNRYYVSKSGLELIKKLPPLEKNYLTETDKFKKKHPNQMNMFDLIEDTFTIDPKDRETNIEAGWKCTLFNKYNGGPYDISYSYYLQEAYKLINLQEK